MTKESYQPSRAEIDRMKLLISGQIKPENLTERIGLTYLTITREWRKMTRFNKWVVISSVCLIVVKIASYTSTDSHPTPSLPAGKCRSAWDHNAPRGLKYAISDQLKDPDSFEVIGSKYAKAPEPNGSVWFSVTYRARNGFGGMTISGLSGYVNPDCSINHVEFADN